MKKPIGLVLCFLALLLVAAGSWFSWYQVRQTRAIPVLTLASEAVDNTTEDEEEEIDAEEAEAASQALALFFGKDDRAFIPAPYPQPFAAIGKLQTESGSHCTATLVAPNLAVTAAHCFLMVARKLDQGVTFWAAFHEGGWQARYQVVGQVFDPRFQKGLDYVGEDVYIQPRVSHYDIAWMKLQHLDGVAPRPIPLFTGTPDQLLAAINGHGDKVTQAGYAHDHNQVLTAHRACKITALIDDNTLEHQCDTLSGDSGSPLFLETAMGPVLVGVQSSAPDWYNRDQADNTAVTVLQLPKKPK